MNIVLLTNHYYKSDKKAGFHFLADAMARAGHHVCFATIGFSLASYLRRDPRTTYPDISSERNALVSISNNLESYVHFTLWHPVNLLLPPLNRMTKSIGTWYSRQPLGDLASRVQNADVIVFESAVGLYLFDRLKKIAPQARFVYRVSDDISMLRMPHPSLNDLERDIAPRFDLVSVPSENLAQKFKRMPAAVPLEVQRHGVAVDKFHQNTKSPYRDNHVNAVFVGAGWFDEDFLEIASRLRTDIQFHIIGPLPARLNRPNVKYLGEMKWDDTLPYLKHARIGLQSLKYHQGAESFTDSLKVLQYCVCKLPIIAPDFLKTTRSNTFYYSPGDADSISLALDAAATHGVGDDGGLQINTWDEVAGSLLVDQ